MGRGLGRGYSLPEGEHRVKRVIDRMLRFIFGTPYVLSDDYQELVAQMDAEVAKMNHLLQQFHNRQNNGTQ